MLSPKAAALFNLVLLASAAPGKRQSTGTGSCTDLHLFVGRGWNEGYPGRHQSLIDATCSGLASCDYEDIRFDATNANGYARAVEQGRASGVSQIRAYVAKCPNSKIVVSGYSEGGNVVANILADSGLTPGAAPGSKICAATLFGDTTHVASQSYNVGAGAAYSGTMARSASSLRNMNRFASVLRSWCNGDDGVCATTSGNDGGEAAHTNYFQLYSNDAAAFIKERCPVPTATATSTVPAPTATGSVCVGGTVKSGLSDSYLGLCSFSCSNGYCPDGVCQCSTFGQPTTPPAGDGRDGCPADGLDESYKGLCSFSCSHGYCPDGACKYC